VPTAQLVLPVFYSKVLKWAIYLILACVNIIDVIMWQIQDLRSVLSNHSKC
jgi:hypothetical protein